MCAARVAGFIGKVTSTARGVGGFVGVFEYGLCGGTGELVPGGVVFSLVRDGGLHGRVEGGVGLVV